MSKIKYPPVRREAGFQETIHDIVVRDPYRWLETDDEERRQFCQEQQNLTTSYLQDAPSRSEIHKRIKELFDFPKIGCPMKRGEYYYMLKNSGLQNQNVMYRFKELNDEDELFIDPNTFSPDGSDSMSIYSFSKDFKWFAYGISKSGSDYIEIRIRNIETKQDLPEKLHNCKFTSISWTHDSLGFFYSGYTNGNEEELSKGTDLNQYHKLFYHQVNTPQSNDIVAYDFPENNKILISSSCSDCGQYLHLALNEKCRLSAWYYAKLDNLPIRERLTVLPIVDNFENDYEYVTNDGDLVYFKTNKSASNFRICTTILSEPEPGNSDNWVEVLPEDDEAVLDDVICVAGDKLACIYARNAIHEFQIHNLEDGQLFRKFDIPIGSISSIFGQRSQNEVFFYHTSYLSPGALYRYDFDSEEDDLSKVIEMRLENFNKEEYITKQVFYESKDGQVKVPMFITHLRNLKMDSSNPCQLFGYGGFQISLQPYFSSSRVMFMKHFKGIYAVANIRGGGEYGANWHDAGKLLNKQNSFDDFQQAAEYLIKNRYTSTEKLIIEGGSNGGLLVCACANQRPDLFAAVISHVGVTDLIRFDKFTIGRTWQSDYGDSTDPEKGLEYFRNQLRLSPLHNVPRDCQKYPAVLLLTSDHDNRVVPLHSYKFVAELQHTIGRKLNVPLLLRIDARSGHGAGKSTEKTLSSLIDSYCFLQKVLNLQFYE